MIGAIILKNKKAIYVLLPLVLLIWSLIIYRIVAGTSSGDSFSGTSNAFSFALEQEKADTFSLVADYTDPFLDHLWEYQEAGAQEAEDPVLEQTVVQSQPVYINWPRVAFSGLVKNQKSNKQVVLVSISDRSHLMKVGDKIDGVSLQKVFADSIVVSYEKEVKTISK